jgi:hypothetical protein
MRPASRARRVIRVLAPDAVFCGLAQLFDLPILETNNPTASREVGMNLRLHNADVVMIIALALLCSLLLALRFRPSTWKGIVVEAVAANVTAIAAVVAIEMLLA